MIATFLFLDSLCSPKVSFSPSAESLTTLTFALSNILFTTLIVAHGWGEGGINLCCVSKRNDAARFVVCMLIMLIKMNLTV